MRVVSSPAQQKRSYPCVTLRLSDCLSPSTQFIQWWDESKTLAKRIMKEIDPKDFSSDDSEPLLRQNPLMSRSFLLSTISLIPNSVWAQPKDIKEVRRVARITMATIVDMLRPRDSDISEKKRKNLIHDAAEEELEIEKALGSGEVNFHALMSVVFPVVVAARGSLRKARKADNLEASQELYSEATAREVVATLCDPLADSIVSRLARDIGCLELVTGKLTTNPGEELMRLHNSLINLEGVTLWSSNSLKGSSSEENLNLLWPSWQLSDSEDDEKISPLETSFLSAFSDTEIFDDTLE